MRPEEIITLNQGLHSYEEDSFPLAQMCYKKKIINQKKKTDCESQEVFGSQSCQVLEYKESTRSTDALGKRLLRKNLIDGKSRVKQIDTNVYFVIHDYCPAVLFSARAGTLLEDPEAHRAIYLEILDQKQAEIGPPRTLSFEA